MGALRPQRRPDGSIRRTAERYSTFTKRTITIATHRTALAVRIRGTRKIQDGDDPAPTVGGRRNIRPPERTGADLRFESDSTGYRWRTRCDVAVESERKRLARGAIRRVQIVRKICKPNEYDPRFPNPTAVFHKLTRFFRVNENLRMVDTCSIDLLFTTRVLGIPRERNPV